MFTSFVKLRENTSLRLKKTISRPALVDRVASCFGVQNLRYSHVWFNIINWVNLLELKLKLKLKLEDVCLSDLSSTLFSSRSWYSSKKKFMWWIFSRSYLNRQISEYIFTLLQLSIQPGSDTQRVVVNIKKYMGLVSFEACSLMKKS